MAEGCFDVQKKKKNKLGEISMLFRRIIIINGLDYVDVWKERSLRQRRRKSFLPSYCSLVEVSDEKHEETPWSSDCLRKIQKFLKQQQNSDNLPPKSIFQKSKQPFALHFFLASCNLPRDDPRNFCANTRIRLFTRNDLCGPVGYHWKKDT